MSLSFSGMTLNSDYVSNSEDTMKKKPELGKTLEILKENFKP